MKQKITVIMLLIIAAVFSVQNLAAGGTAEVTERTITVNAAGSVAAAPMLSD